MCDRSMLAGYSACVCSEPCGACLCCGRGLEDVAWLTGLRRASDSRMGSKESQTIIRPRRAELSCSTTVINGLSYPVLTGGDQRLTQIGSKRGTLGLRSWGDRQGLWQVLLPSPPHTLCLAVPPPPPTPNNLQGDIAPGCPGRLRDGVQPFPLSPWAAKRAGGMQRLCHRPCAGGGLFSPRCAPRAGCSLSDSLSR